MEYEGDLIANLIPTHSSSKRVVDRSPHRGLYVSPPRRSFQPSGFHLSCAKLDARGRPIRGPVAAEAGLEKWLLRG